MEPKTPDESTDKPAVELQKTAKPPEVDAPPADDEFKRPIENRERESEQREHGELTEE
jgi:hypothetical protein